MTIKVAIWDDRDPELGALREKLLYVFRSGEKAELMEFDRSKISAAVTELERRHSVSLFANSTAILDEIGEIDVLCIDYDLRMLEHHSWLTADTLAGLIRAFTQCPCVVVLNRPPRVGFDLTMTGGWEGPADLQIPQAAILRPAFWQRRSKAGVEEEFWPWSWLELENARARANQRLEDLASLDLREVDVFTFLGFDQDMRERLSQRALGTLSTVVKGTAPSLSLADFLRTGARALMPDTIEKILEAQSTDEAARTLALRVISFDLGRWLREQLLAGQDVLVDVPHLISRAPWLLGSDMGNLATWNLAIGSAEHLLQRSGWLAEYQWTKAHWLDRTAFNWPGVQAASEMQEATSILRDTDAPDFSFLEDRSCFSLTTNAEDYLADFGNVWDRRYVKKPVGADPEITYGPMARFAL